MLYDEIEDPASMTGDELRARYEAELAETIQSVGIDAVDERTAVERDTLEALVAGDSPTVTMEDAAAILATADDAPAADDILFEVRDHIMLQMTTAVLDVDTLAAELDSELGGKEIQQKIEGRSPMTLAEYALIHQFIAAKADR